MAKIIGGIVVLVIVAALGVWVYLTPADTNNGNNNGGTQTGQKFSSPNVRVDTPTIGASVDKTFTVSGEVRGNWTFEANLPLKVVDPSGEQIGVGYGMTTEDWMTTEFVPFTGQVTVADYSGPAKLVLMKDNPSGMPENDDSVEFDIVIE